MPLPRLLDTHFMLTSDIPQRVAFPCVLNLRLCVASKKPRRVSSKTSTSTSGTPTSTMLRSNCVTLCCDSGAMAHLLPCLFSE